MNKLALLISLVALVVLANRARAEVITVAQRQSIQAAIKRAKAGDTIRVMPGRYKESLYIDKDGVRLSGVIEDGRWPVLDGENVLNDGILVAGHDVTVERFVVRRYLGNGIMTQGANNFAILNNRVEGPGFYGIFPQYGQNGLVSHNVVSGNVTGIYVGMSKNLDVLHNESANNQDEGIEIENSSEVLVEDNYSHGNAVGIVLHLIPGLPIKTAERAIVRNNFVIKNDRGIEAKTEASSAPVVESGLGQYPNGTGILIDAQDSSTIEGNLIEGNPSGAIYVTDQRSGQLFPVPDPKEDPFPDDNKILENRFIENGQKPYGRTLKLLTYLKQTQAPDLLVVGTGRGNCILSKDSLSTLGAESWSECPKGTSSDALTSMRLKHPVTNTPLTLEQKGRLAWLAVCTGCHTYSTRLMGPPMVAARAPYMGNPQKLADWIAHPTKKRADYPAMPPQNYLPPEVRLEVAKYVLEQLQP
jgi:parallel beta-helix repeat protein